jgi:hypothetical protein
MAQLGFRKHPAPPICFRIYLSLAAVGAVADAKQATLMLAAAVVAAVL